MKPTFYSLFAGGDLAGWGAKAAGCEVVGGIEACPEIAEVARANGCPITVSRVEDADPMKAPCVPTILWASPVCTRASVANANAGENELDMTAARATARWIETLLPPNFVMENVRGYMKFDAYNLIRDTLDRCGYWTQASVLNSADFGVPQSRHRLILRATRNGFLPPLPLKEKWRGWYQAIEDLIPDLPESAFAQWQLDRLPESLFETSLVTGQANTSREATVLTTGKPCATVIGNWAHRPSHMPWAFICEGSAAGVDNRFTMPVRESAEPVFTMRAIQNNPRAFIANGTPNDRGRSLTTRDDGENGFAIVAQSGQRQQLRAWLNEGRVVKMTPRALCRFQSIPDSYLLPEKSALACRIIGNAVPPLLAQKIIAPLLCGL